MRKIFTWSYSALAAITGALAVIVTQSPAAENNSDVPELIRVEMLLGRLANGRDGEVADVARILLEHWRARRYLVEFKAPLRIDPQAGRQDTDRLEAEMKNLAEVGAARTTAVGQPQYQTEVSQCVSDYDMCAKVYPRFTCTTVSTMCIATTLVPFVEGSK